MERYLKVNLDLVVDKNLTANDLRVYLYLLTNYNTDKGYAYPSLDTMAEKIHMSVSTVKRAIKKLEELKYITIEKRQGLSGNFNIYKRMKHFMKNNIKAAAKKNSEINDISIETSVEIDKEEAIVDNSYNEKQSKLDNHTNVRLARSITDIDKSKFAKTVLTMCDEMLVREAIRDFKAKKGKSATFLIQLIVDEYFKAKINFPNRLFNLLKSGLKNPYLTQPI